MSLHHIPFESLEEAHLQALVADHVAERKILEYKVALPGNAHAAKREFLADLSSFANAAGGHLLYGIREEAGIAREVVGLHGIDPDAQKQRLENIIRDGIEPRIPGVAMRPIPLRTGEVVMAIRIPRSWALPHVVTFEGHWRFYSRNSAGKYPLDVAEVRAAFALSETAADRIRKFRAERLSMIVAGETPVALQSWPKTVFHLVPLNAFDPAVKYDVASLANNVADLAPIGVRRWNYRHNFDGFLTYAQIPTYLQVFRTGALEAVESIMLRPRDEGDKRRTIPSMTFEQQLILALPRFLGMQKYLGVEPPVMMMLTLLGVAGYTMGVRTSLDDILDAHSIDRDALLVSDVMLETFECDTAEAMKPLFDTVWNAAGWPRSMNYDQEGKWVGR